MSDKTFELLMALADGRAHSGADLARAAGVSRAAIWARVQRLQALGLEILAVPGKGYRLAQGFEFLDETTIRGELSPAANAAIPMLTCLQVTDSTNERLLQQATAGTVHGHALFAEYQSAGRGRRGDVWVAPPGSGLCVSLGWRFDAPPATMSALGLAVGIAVARAVDDLGLAEVRLKWPNDVLYDGRKLAGILIEMRAEHGGPSTVVIGIGLNVHIPARVRAGISQPVVDLHEALGRAPARNRIAARLLEALTQRLADFSRAGFAPLAAAWAHYDGLAGRRVQLELPGRAVVGMARGVDPTGMLLIEQEDRTEAFLSGHVRVLAP
jgi:BirA family biotin operon repressor/biotin-[acetyl-CoA-carboxylase] ligase